MDIMEAIAKRVSVRAYEDKDIEEEIIKELESYIGQLNEESGLSFQLYGPRQEGEQAFTMSPKMFSGPVYHYVALVGPETPEGGDKVGYYGEKLVLFATQLGLGTCWVAGTYDQASTLWVTLRPRSPSSNGPYGLPCARGTRVPSSWWTRTFPLWSYLLGSSLP